MTHHTTTPQPFWRELADQLTADPIGDIEHLDGLVDIPGSGFGSDSPRRIAEGYVAENQAQTRYADLGSLPPAEYEAAFCRDRPLIGIAP